MASEIKVDTISEKTSANGIAIDSVTLKDGTVTASGDTAAGDNASVGYTSAEGLILTGQGSTSDVTLKNDADGTVFTVPTGTDDVLFPDSAKAMWGAGSDMLLYHDGSNSYITNAVGALKIATETSGIALTIGHTTSETTVADNLTVTGTTAFTGVATFNADPIIAGTTPTLTIGDAGAEDTSLVFDGNAQDYHIGLDDTSDKLVIGKGTALGTTTSMAFDANGIVTKPLQPLFRISQTGALDVADGATLFTANTTEDYDVNGDMSGGTFTAPVDGYYLFIATIFYQSVTAGTGTFEDQFVSSNQTEQIVRVGMLADAFESGGYISSWNSTILFMDASDTMYCKHGDGGTFAVAATGAFTSFKGCLLQ